MRPAFGPSFTNIDRVSGPEILLNNARAFWKTADRTHFLHEIAVPDAEIHRSRVFSNGRLVVRDEDSRPLARYTSFEDAPDTAELRIDGAVCYCGHSAARRNYGHLIVDVFQGLTVMLDRGFEGTFLLDAPPPPLDRILQVGLDLLGIPAGQVAYVQPERRTRVGDIVVPAGHMLSAKARDGASIRSLSARLARALPALPRGDHALYVQRGQEFETRGAENVEDLLAAISPHVSEIRRFDPLAHDLGEQLAAFRSARVIVGTMGAALCSLIACRPGTPLLYLVPAQMPGLYYYALNRALSLPYLEIRARETAPSRNQVFRLAPEDIRDCTAALARLLDRQDSGGAGP